MNSSGVITFKGMPLFQKEVIHSSFTMQGELKDVACFFYVVQGRMSSVGQRGKDETTAKNAVIKNCGRYVQMFTTNPTDPACEVIAVYLYPDLLKEIYKDEIPSYLSVKEIPPPRKIIGNVLVEQYMQNLAIYFESPESFDEELGVLKLKELILILLKSENHTSLRQLLSEVFSPVNLGLKQAVENNLYNELTMEQLAFICHMSLSTFKREFKKVFNDTPARYIKHRRLSKAKHLLQTTDASITDIAFEVGFVDISTFSANFQDKYGMSPSIYRLSQKTG
jgi:AraC-like DNA-binding protein